MRLALVLRDPAQIARAKTAMTIVLLRSGAIAAKFGIALFIAHFLDLAALGLYGLVAGAVVVIPVLTGLGLIAVVSRASVGQTPAEVVAALVPYWSLVSVLYLAATAAVLPWALLHGHAVSAGLVGALLLVEHLNADAMVILNHRQRPRLANLLFTVRTGLWIGAYIGLAFLVAPLRSLPAVLAFWLAGATVALVGFFWACRTWPWRAALTAPGRVAAVLATARTSRTLYLNELANTGGQYVDRYVVGAFLGLEPAGVYFLFWSLANALSNVVNTSLLQVQQPAIILARREPVRQARLLGHLRVETALASVVLAAATALLASVALTLVPRPGVAGTWPVLAVLLAGFVLRMVYEVEGIGLFGRHEDGNILASALIVLGLSLAATMTLTPLLGLLGPALAVVVSYLAGWLWRWQRNRSAPSGPPLPSPLGMGC